MTETSRPRAAVDRIDRRVTPFLAGHGLTFLRLALGLVFLWFGALKLFPGLSPAEDLAARTIDVLSNGLIPRSLALPGLALWESAIGIGLMAGKWMRATLLLLVVQMLGTLAPLVLFQDETWLRFPIAPTLEGQYIIKNVVLVTAALVLGATVRGGELTSEPISR
ncbi:MAG TPA: DoxX family protein [Acidimicrobiia bacterium]|nr:DoxX family protein [Acidimicrobiia bacterium]